MAISVVATGAVAITGTSTVSPTFGATTTSGNMLVARVHQHSSTGGAQVVSGATGWNAIGFNDGTQTSVMWYKYPCAAGETPPTFTVSGTASGMWADLIEISGAGVVYSHSEGNLTSISSPLVVSTSVATSAPIIEIIGIRVINGSGKTATWTFTDSWASAGTTVAAQGSGSTKADQAVWGSGRNYTANPSSGSDSITITPSTGTLSTIGSYIAATFAPPTPTAPAAPTGVTATNTYGGSMKVTWTDDTTGYPSPEYVIYRSTDNTNFTPATNNQILQGTQLYRDDGGFGYTTQTTAASTIPIGNIAANTRVAVPIWWPGRSGQIGGVVIWNAKVGAPADVLNFDIQSDSSGSPSGTSLVGGGTATTPTWTTLSTNGLYLSNTLATAQLVWLVFSRSGAADASNYWIIGGGASTNTGTSAKIYNGSTWATTTATPYFYFNSIIPLPAGTYYYKVYATNATGAAGSTSASATEAYFSKANSFDGGSNGTTITLANSGTGSGDAFDTIAGTTAPKFNNTVTASGPMGALLTAGATASSLAWNVPANIWRLWGRTYFEISATGTAVNLVKITTSGGTWATYTVNSSGHITVLDSTGATVFTGAATISANTLYRLEFALVFDGTTKPSYQLYVGAATSATEFNGPTSGTFSGTPTSIVFGGATATVTTYIDEVGLSDIGYIGPYSNGFTYKELAISGNPPYTLGGKGLIQLSDGTPVWVSYIADGSYVLQYTSDRSTVNTITTFANGTFPAGNFINSISLCRDASDNLYVIGASTASTPVVTAIAFVKGSGYSWTQKSAVTGALAGSSSGTVWYTPAATWCNTGGGTSSAGHILALHAIQSAANSSYSVLDAGVLLAGSGTLVVSSASSPTFYLTTTVMNSNSDLSPDGFGATQGLTVFPFTTTSLTVGKWAISSSGTLTTNTTISSISSGVATLTGNTKVHLIRVSSNLWAIVYPSNTGNQYGVAKYSFTASVTSGTTAAPTGMYFVSNTMGWSVSIDYSSNKLWIYVANPENVAGASPYTLNIYRAGVDVSGTTVVFDSAAVQDSIFGTNFTTVGYTLRCSTQPTAGIVDFQMIAQNSTESTNTIYGDGTIFYLSITSLKQMLWNTTGQIYQSRQELWNSLLGVTQSRQVLFTVFTGKVFPDGIASNTGFTGAYTDVDEDPLSPDANWITGTSAGGNIRFTFATPSGTVLSSTRQKFRILVRT